jgi:hypothetical protein
VPVFRAGDVVTLRNWHLYHPRWPAFVGWAALVANLGAAGLAALQWTQNYLANHGDSDFKIYYLAARIGVTHGWQHIYDPSLQDAGWKLLGDGFSQLACRIAHS